MMGLREAVQKKTWPKISRFLEGNSFWGKCIVPKNLQREINHHPHWEAQFEVDSGRQLALVFIYVFKMYFFAYDCVVLWYFHIINHHHHQCVGV